MIEKQPSLSSSKQSPPYLEVFSLLLFFFSLSMLAWSGTFHSSDGQAMYAVSDSLARYGQWDAEQFRWTGSQQGNLGADGLLYSRKGFGASLAALPLVWLGLYLPGIGPVHAALLLTPIIHALTAVYLYYTVRYIFPPLGQRGALGIAFLWAFGSMAIAYVKTFFSDPVVSLTMSASLFHLIRFRSNGSLRDAAWLGGWLAFSFMTRSANAIVFPYFGLALLAYAHSQWVLLSAQIEQTSEQSHSAPNGFRWLWQTWTLKRVFAFGVPIFFSGLLYLWFNWYRFGDPLSSGYIEGEEFSAILWQGILGQTISPGRGLLWYTPWLPLAFVGAGRLWSRDRVLTGTLLGSIILYILFYGKWYLWSGGFAWGPRFLVPILPFLAFLCAPLLLPRKERGAPLLGGWPTSLKLLGVLGFLINLIGVLWDFDLHQNALIATGLPLFAPETFFSPQYAQITGLLNLGLETPGAIDLAWMVNGITDWRLLAFVFAIVLAGFGSGLWGWRHRNGHVVVGIGTGLLIVSTWFLLRDMRATQSPVMQALLTHFANVPPANSQLWFDHPPVFEAILNQIKEPLPIIGFNVEGTELSPEDAKRTKTLAENAQGPIYLITDGPDQEANGLDHVLLEDLFWAGEYRFENFRLSEYWMGPLNDPLSYYKELLFPEGTTIILQEAQFRPTIVPDEQGWRLSGHRYRVPLLLTWQTTTPLPENYQIFIHLYNDKQQMIWQQDSSPTQGRHPTSTWTVGETYEDHHMLLLPNDLAPGTYTIHFGLYRLSDLARATAQNGQNEMVVTFQIQ